MKTRDKSRGEGIEKFESLQVVLSTNSTERISISLI